MYRVALVLLNYCYQKIEVLVDSRDGGVFILIDHSKCKVICYW